VVGEVQKAYNALASILKRDADEMYSTVEKLRTGPIAMPRDLEWSRFVRSDVHFVNPEMPLRRLEEIEYPGKHHPATTEVRAGMLERKSKYLKSYTPGWSVACSYSLFDLTQRRYVLSPTHIHEFKSADRIYTQPPVMSLYLPDQKLGSRSQPGSSSHKFVIKGRQAGSMHRGHTWVFRAETYETMAAWFDDIKALTEKSGEERNAFVRRHASVRSVSASSARSASSDGGLEEDEADAIPFSANQSMKDHAIRDQSPPRPSRPSPGGRFPSDLMVQRNLQAPLSPSSRSSSDVGNDLATMSGGPPQEIHPMYLAQSSAYQPEPVKPVQQYTQPIQQPQSVQYAPPIQHPQLVNPYPAPQQLYDPLITNDNSYAPPTQNYAAQAPHTENYDQRALDNSQPIQRHDSNNYGNWMAPAAGGVATGALANEAYRKKQMAEQHVKAQQQEIIEQAEQQSQQHQYPAEEPRSMDYQDITPVQQIPARHPDHVLPDQIDDTGYVAPPTSAIPAPIIAPAFDNQQPDSPQTTSSFLDESEVGASPAFGHGQTVNGGPVPVELVDTAEAMAHPGMGKRMNTEDIHVPGEYPRSEPRVPTAGTAQQSKTFLTYN
jgi:hypothetical protein